MFFFFNDPATTEIYTLSLHDALPICEQRISFSPSPRPPVPTSPNLPSPRSEEHTSELQSHVKLVCRLLLEKKKKINKLSLQLPGIDYNVHAHIHEYRHGYCTLLGNRD